MAENFITVFDLKKSEHQEGNTYSTWHVYSNITYFTIFSEFWHESSFSLQCISYFWNNLCMRHKILIKKV